MAYGQYKFDTLETRINVLEEEMAKYINTFRHYHVNKMDGTDSCKECGLDIRDPIHSRSL